MSYFNFVAEATTLNPTGGAVDIPQLGVVIANFLGLASALAGMLAVITIVIGGFKYITAQGDPKAVQSAKSTITWALIGLVLLVVAFLVLRLIEDVTGVPVTKFSIPTN